ncbi:MAK10-like protein [Tanacetum coccineum]
MNSRPLPDFEEYAVSTSSDTMYMIPWSTLRANTISSNTATRRPYTLSELLLGPRNQNEPPTLSTFAFRKRTGPSPQPQALNTIFEARVRDYMAAHTKRMERFENTIFKQREEIDEEEGSNRTKVTPGNAEKPTETETETPVMEGLVNNNRFNNSRSRTQAGKKKGKEYKVLPGRPAYDAILKKMITKMEDIKGNFKIPCSVRNIKHVNAIIDQGSDVNVMPYSTYMKLTDEKLAETDIRLSLASHSYVYPLGSAEDVLVEIAEHASIKFDSNTITLRSGKHKVSFHRKPDSSNMIDKGVKNDIEPIALNMTVNRLVLEWEEKIKLHLEKEMQFNQWRSKNFKGMHPTLITTKEEVDDEGEVT